MIAQWRSWIAIGYIMPPEAALARRYADQPTQIQGHPHALDMRRRREARQDRGES